MDYFPLSLAGGKSFCNRKAELQHIQDNIKKCVPTLVASPRRYGKTSLVLQSIRSVKCEYTQFDFLSATEPADIEHIILNGIGQLIARLAKGPQKALKLATELLADLNIKISLGMPGVSVTIDHKDDKPAYNILKVIKRIEQFAEKKKIKIVLFFDEFQHLYQITEDHAIESVLREVAQSSKSLSFIFSGSNRNLLNQMFDDSERPFYKLCDKITLDRIHAEDYIDYMQHAAKQQWRKQLEEASLTDIFLVTQRHPYYINLLCSRLWRLNAPPSSKDVISSWQQYVMEERAQVATELDLMSKNQSKLLIKIARIGEIAQPKGIAFQTEANMSNASIAQALTFLEKRDYVMLNQNGAYQVLDPLISAVLTRAY